jgi:KaiC/GvpD/RAD55 family RecA-like ATPase
VSSERSRARADTTRRDLQAVHRDIEPEPHEAAGEAFEQTIDAANRLTLKPEAYLHFPWPAIDSLIGGVAPEDVWFLAGFSGNGKTTFLINLVDEYLRADRTVYYLGLETRPHVLRTQLSCLRLGVYAGDVLSGAAKSWDDWDDVRTSLVIDLETQRALGTGNKFLVNGVPMVDSSSIIAASRDAAMSSSDLVIIDHVDHLRSAEGRSPFEQSRIVVDLLLELAKEHGQRFLVATQCNNESLKGDRLGVYSPPQPHHVYMGAHKRMIATGMIGLYRPMRTNVGKDTLSEVRSGKREVRDVLEPGTMGVVLMKHRYYGAREGMRASLRLDQGRLFEIAERDRYSTKGEGPRV